MTGRIDKNKYTTAPLTADMVQGDATVLTVEDAGESKFDNRDQVWIIFREVPECKLYLNARGVRDVIAALGDNPADWRGQRVPLEKRTVDNPSTGGKVVKLYPLPPQEWRDVIAEFDAAMQGGGKTTKKTARKSGR